MCFEIILHPVVLLEIIKKKNIEFFNQKNVKRKVGCLMGYKKKDKISVTFSFSLPFEQEDFENNWFIDYYFIEKMTEIHKKINTKESILGWYSTGKKIHRNDTDIYQIFRGYTKYPIQLLLWINPKSHVIFMCAFVNQNNVSEKYLLKNVSITIGMLESEKIGIFYTLKHSESLGKLLHLNVLKNYIELIQMCIRHILKFLQCEIVKTRHDFSLKKFYSIFKKILLISNANFLLEKKKITWVIFSLVNILNSVCKKLSVYKKFVGV
ncbi:26S proteasome regulatory SU (nucleomorph) [Cryptomonas paramecium]|uniref:26S proteasome regulatory SU n=1 Tax=Cryptomonas paramaecium TaxID=2898 RepID=F2HIB2_9CRYP|nr:26S proteasome regulatory SU [Cryptomonas paramecium]AEA39036.1 26S proteasome regulatory SU [Cryptomonas paramecium]|mmetsp:Transcript_52135/g.136251  ORF Transcript_52135/g.136251 Transcript_52135/m.136251 type:complete len:266 (-) Transcript_52135:3895-4692(-)